MKFRMIALAACGIVVLSACNQKPAEPSRLSEADKASFARIQSWVPPCHKNIEEVWDKGDARCDDQKGVK